MNLLAPVAPLKESKKVFVKTYGCQMNVYDTQRMEEVLGAEGYSATTTMDDADLVILNTCHIREKAVSKVYSEIGRIRVLRDKRRKTGSDMLIAVAGCVAQAEAHEIVKREKAVDLVFGPQTYHRLPELLKEQKRTGRSVVETEFPAEDKFDGLQALASRKATGHGVAAFLTIQEGCDKFCSFCVVPYTRGAEFSRSITQIVSEARGLAETGVREITLLGQNVNAYRGLDAAGEHSNLAHLVSLLSDIDGLERIRYTTSHPNDMSDALIAAHAENAKLMPHLHLPVQSGNDRILKAMNRGHTVADYIRSIEKVRKARPDIGITSDFIVGFPSETDAEFEDTMKLICDVNYASGYSFKYSPRPGTPAAELDTAVPDDVSSERLARLQVLLSRQLHKFNDDCTGKTMSVLLEKLGRESGQIIGRSPYLQSVHVATNQAVGSLIDVRITGTSTNSLVGEFVV